MTVSRVTRRMNSPHIGHSFACAHRSARRLFLTTWRARPYREARVFRPHRSHASRLALETLVPHERAYRRSLSDEVAIDFPSSRAAIELFRRDHGEPAGAGAIDRTPRSRSRSARPAPAPWCRSTFGCRAPAPMRRPRRGVERALRALRRPGPGTAHAAPDGGRAARRHDGDRFSFNVSPPRGPRTRVDVRVAVIGVKRHVDFLSTLYLTWGGIFTLVALAGFALAGGAFAIAPRTARFASAQRWRPA